MNRLWMTALLFSNILMASELPNDPTLEIQFASPSAGKKQVFRRSALLQRKEVVAIEIPEEPTYGTKKIKYQAIAVADLLKETPVPPQSVLQFKCQDGFSVPIPADKVLAKKNKKAMAYIAIEPPHQKWPALHPPSNPETAGPFYLIWKDAAASHIQREEWPFQLVGIEVKASLAASFPRILPDPKLPKTHPVYRGFDSFTQNCLSCHTLNRQGESTMGPDLNVPMNPTEYFQNSALKKLIRDPQSLRFWPAAKMHGFTSKDLSDSELANLLAYLRHMAGRKVDIQQNHGK